MTPILVALLWGTSQLFCAKGRLHISFVALKWWWCWEIYQLEHTWHLIHSNSDTAKMMDPENPPTRDPAQVAASNRLEATQKQVNDVVDIMKTNVERIIEREEKLTNLDERANNLTTSASQFQQTSRKLKRKYWWKNLKMMLILGCIVILVIVIIIVAVVGIPSGSGDGGDGHPTNPPPSTTTIQSDRAVRAILGSNNT
ncbi:Vesicle-associated membrane protein 2 [Halocaridina rubra]|uniref:Vesicle-associated membrane protein 2 n=1 Tax=Halocaridina rubra TaxID=373956 RepID=A0AAN8WQ78_HALRR